MNLKDIKLLNLLLVFTVIFAGCSQTTENITTESKDNAVSETTNNNSEDQLDADSAEPTNDNADENDNSSATTDFDEDGYTVVSSDSCNLSGGRVPNAKVDIGYDSDYANREYWAYTNDYGQLVHVEADEIVLQNDDVEISGDDRYCDDEAKVPGVEQSDLDEGHVIADSLGGASNAYNITPQGSQLNRYGTQADIEEEIREAGGATDFEADIEYPDTNTQIPSSYTLSYTVNGTEQSHTYANEYTPDGEQPVQTEEATTTTETDPINTTSTDGDVYYENCTAVRDAGADPIRTGDPGYSSKLDRDGDGVACE